MNARTELLQLLRVGLDSGFVLDWRVEGSSRGWPGPALLSWALRLRQHWRRQLAPRARIAVILPNSPAFIAHWLAAWQGDWVFCPLPVVSDAELQRRVELLAPQLLVEWRDGAVQERWNPAAQRCEDPDDLATIYWSSASMGPGSAYGLSHAALLWQWQRHAPALAMSAASLVRNTLPWSHVFAGVLELLPALLAAAEYRVAPLGEIREESFTHLCTVPRVAALLPERAVNALKGGIVGGAAVDAALAKHLQGSALRVGYGQTEAGPGVTLGEAGIFSAACVGMPLAGVEMALGDTLRYRSPGSALGHWDGNRWEPIADTKGWIESGDRIVPSSTEPGFFWQGRIDAAFKLADGRRIQPEAEEIRLQSRYPALTHLVLGAPGQRRLTVLAVAPFPDWRALASHWYERYPLYLLPPEQWSAWQGPLGKVRRARIYGHWQQILEQAWRA